MYEQTILEKLRQVSPERLAEVEDFVDFLAHRQEDERGLTHAAGQLATAAFTRVWDNPADADYGRLGIDGSGFGRSADCSFGVRNVDRYVSWYTRPTAGGVIVLRTKSFRTCSNRRMLSAE